MQISRGATYYGTAGIVTHINVVFRGGWRLAREKEWESGRVWVERKSRATVRLRESGEATKHAVHP